MSCPKFKSKREVCPLCQGVLYDVWYRKGIPPPMNPNEFNEIESEGWTTIRPLHTHEKKRSPEIIALHEEWDRKLRNL
ncbi:hypothetical protein ACFL0D_07195 [Thermoproteota archaeon]